MPICFDLDGTLGSFMGGYGLLRETLGRLWACEPPTLEELRACPGSTDWEIVDHLHRAHFGEGLDAARYEAFEAACLARFRAEFHPEGRVPTRFRGILEGLHLLAERHPVRLVSGNAPALLDFKAEALGISPRIPRHGSRPGHSRAGLIRAALAACEGPASGQGGGPCGCGRALYVGDQPHDLAAAREAGVPFLGVGPAVPGDHPVLDPDAEAHRLVAAVEALLGN